MAADACREGEDKIGQISEDVVRPVSEVRGRVLIKTVHALREKLVPQEPDHPVIADFVVPGGIPGVQPQCACPGQKLQERSADKGREDDQEPEEHRRRLHAPAGKGVRVG